MAIDARRALGGVFFAHGMLFASWTAHIPHVKSHLGLSDGGLGAVLLATPVGSVSAMAVGAWLLPRVGSRLLSMVCLTGYAVAGPFVGLANSSAQLFVALLCWGAFQGTLDVAMNTQATTQEHHSGRTLMSGLHGRWSLGALAGAGIGALGVWAGVSLAWQLTVLGAFVLLGVPLVRVLHPFDDHERPPATPASGQQRTWTRATLRSVTLLGAIAMVSFLAEGAAADWSAVYLRSSVGAAAAVASSGYAVYSLATVTTRLLADRLFGSFDQAKVVSWLAAIATVGFAAALITGRLAVALIGLICLGVGLATVVPTMFSAAGRLPNLPASTGIATVTAFGWAGFVCGPPLIGGLANATSLPWALGLIPLLTAFIAVGARRALRASAC
jgi:fucose permease